jgi:hypothetical protein
MFIAGNCTGRLLACRCQTTDGLLLPHHLKPQPAPFLLQGRIQQYAKRYGWPCKARRDGAGNAEAEAGPEQQGSAEDSHQDIPGRGDSVDSAIASLALPVHIEAQLLHSAHGSCAACADDACHACRRWPRWQPIPWHLL